MEIYNLKHLNQDKRFVLAIVVGILASFVFGILSGYIRRIISFGNIEFPIIYWAASYATAMTIQRFGRGVQHRFAILGGICGFFTAIISDATLMGGLVGAFSFPVYHVAIMSLLVPNMFAFLGLLYRAVSAYIGYNYSRIV